MPKAQHRFGFVRCRGCQREVPKSFVNLRRFCSNVRCQALQVRVMATAFASSERIVVGEGSQPAWKVLPLPYNQAA
jgi:endogenous inhibitor of DNA gyrase (YacG/DUF329 family)